MQTIFDLYEPIYTEKPTYFAGANRAEGFVGGYDTIADERKLERVYVIKGGAGTGKSTLMRHLAYEGEKAGYGVVRYLCGSDPQSLDCVVLDGRIGILDGTAPHNRDMTFPGATSSLIDLSRFWNEERLRQRKGVIAIGATEKARAYRSAYRYFGAAEQIEKEKRAYSENVFLREKAMAAVDRLVKGWEKGKKWKRGRGNVTLVETSALTMKGAFRLINGGEGTQKYSVTESYGCESLFMELLTEALLAAGHDIVLARLPVPYVIESVYVPAGRILVTVGKEAEGKSINMARFFRREERGEFRLATKLQLSCLNEGLRYLSKAAVQHFELEKEYAAAMDFEALNRYEIALREEILSQLERER